MKHWRVITCFSVSMLLAIPVFGGEARQTGNEYPVQYEGGTLPFKQNHPAKAVVAGGEVVFVQHGQRITVPVGSIDGISCATDVHRRFGAAILGLVPLMDLDKVEDHYVAVTWNDETRTGGARGRVEVLFKMNGGEYRHFVATLERLTGKRAVDTNKTPTVVDYSL